MWGVVDTHLSLEEYWETLQIAECAGYGIRGAPAHITGMGCGDYWDHDERYWLAFAIRKVEKRLARKRWLKFPIRREYYETVERRYRGQGYPVNCYVGCTYEDEQSAPHKFLRCIGDETEVVVQEALALTLGAEDDPNDPVTFTVAVTFSDVNELVLYYTGQDPRKYKIRPSKVTYDSVAETMTVEIPRCRLLSPDYLTALYESDADRPPYSGTDSNDYYEDEIDVVRNYCDSTVGATLVWPPGDCDSAPCTETTYTACPYIQNEPDGIFKVTPAEFDTDDWVWSRIYPDECDVPTNIRYAYMAGKWDRYETIDEDLVRAIIALAHNNLPQEYCSCAMQQRYYKRDTNPIEPPVNFGLGHSTWGVKEASEIVHELKPVEGMYM